VAQTVTPLRSSLRPQAVTADRAAATLDPETVRELLRADRPFCFVRKLQVGHRAVIGVRVTSAVLPVMAASVTFG
jgi:hypothetical protein